MEFTNIAALTPAGDANYPPYISVNRHADEPKIEVTLRGDRDGEKCGQTVTARFTREEFALFLVRCAQKL